MKFKVPLSRGFVAFTVREGVGSAWPISDIESSWSSTASSFPPSQM